MHCLILGAGYATRLYPLTKDRPKPLLPLGGVPILSRTCRRIFEVEGLRKLCIVSNHRFVRHYYNWLRDFERRGTALCPIEIFDDLTTTNDDRLGAIGDMQFVIRHARIDDDLLVVAGDNVIEFPLQNVAALGREKGSCITLKDLGSKDLVSLYSQVELDAAGRVVDFEEKPPQPRTSLISIGVYFFGRAHVPLIGEYLKRGRGSDRPGDYIQWLHKKIELYGHVVEGEWFDIGDIDSYNVANDRYMSGNG